MLNKDISRILFLDTDIDSFGEYFRVNREKAGIKSQKLYKETGILKRKVILFLGHYISDRFCSFIYGDWIHHIEDYDLIILPSRLSAKYAIQLIKHTHTRTMVYYWNLVTDKEINPEYLKLESIPCCTFDEGDALKYSIPFVGTYFFNQTPKLNTHNGKLLFYVGIARPGRQEIIQKIQEVIGNSCEYDIHIVNIGSMVGRLSYQETVDRIQRADIILDLTREEQRGLTLRPLEALFFEKKLITNNRFIKNYDFYRPENIFILDENNWDELPDFLAGNYSPVEDEIKSKYTFDSWLKKVIDYVQ